ncbi:MAG: hypothetical protein V7604_2756, partial [Hyphomicrobiales bacterium]
MSTAPTKRHATGYASLGALLAALGYAAAVIVLLALAWSG